MEIEKSNDRNRRQGGGVSGEDDRQFFDHGQILA
jgi:hypothetical protein